MRKYRYSKELNDTAVAVRTGTYVSGATRPTPVAYPISDVSPLGDGHLAALDTIRETSGPFERAIGLVLRTAPFAATWFALALGLMVLIDSDWPIPFFVFAGLTAVTYWALNQQEYAHSAGGLERHKADLAHDLQKDKQAKDHELKQEALGAYIRQLEGDR